MIQESVFKQYISNPHKSGFDCGVKMVALLSASIYTAGFILEPSVSKFAALSFQFGHKTILVWLGTSTLQSAQLVVDGLYQSSPPHLLRLFLCPTPETFEAFLSVIIQFLISRLEISSDQDLLIEGNRIYLHAKQHGPSAA